MTSHNNVALIRDVIAELDSKGRHYEVLSPADSRAAVEWLNRFPEAAVAHIDWSTVSGSVCRHWDYWDELVRGFDQLCDAAALDDPLVIVIWTNVKAPCVQLPLSLVRHHALEIFQADSDVWVTCPELGWCIEKWHEGTLCYGRLADL